MKLSKKNVALLRAIHDALASGKALGGLLVGFVATVAGCRESHSPAHTMGRFPDPRYQENSTNENKEVFVTEWKISQPKQGSSKTNAVQELQREGGIRGRITPMKKLNDVNEVKDEPIVMGGVGGDS